MIPAIQHASRRTRTWRRLAALAFAAVAILVLRPVCDAAETLAGTSAGVLQAESARQPGDFDACCVSLGDASTVLAAVAAPGAAEPLSGSVPPSAFAQHSARERRDAVRDPAPPPRILSYHARSARRLL